MRINMAIILKYSGMWRALMSFERSCGGWKWRLLPAENYFRANCKQFISQQSSKFCIASTKFDLPSNSKIRLNDYLLYE